MRLYIFLLVFATFSCEFFKPKEIDTNSLIAKVGDDYLYISDLEGLFPKNASSADSTLLAEKYALDWVKKQLMIAKSKESIDVNEAEIERKVLDYRYALIVHSYIKKYIDAHIDYNVAEKEIEKYYQEKADNFLLKQHIVKCMYVQVPRTAPNVSRFRSQLKDFPNKNEDDVKSYISQFASKSYLEDSVWVIFDEVTVGTPLEGLKDKRQFLEVTSFSETSNDEYVYFLKIVDYKLTDETSPLEFIREDIKDIIINKKKITLKKELEEKIYDEAKEGGLFEVYRN
jgi:hypothetical protein